MPVIKTTQTWNGMLVDQYTDTDTGAIEIRSAESFLGLTRGNLLASSTSGNNWVINDSSDFLRRYNNSQTNDGNPTVTSTQFNQLFYTNGALLFNNDRAAVLNADSNYESAEIAENNQRAFFAAGTPGVTDPVSGITVNKLGQTPTQPTTGQQPDPDDPDATPLGDAGGDGTAGDGTGDGTGTGTGDGQTSTPIESVDANGNVTTSTERGGTREVLKYPYHDPPSAFKYDYISITAYDYQPSGLTPSYQIDKNLGTPYEEVIFPMQPQLSETNAVNWGDDQLNPIQAMLGQAAKGLIQGLGGFNIKQIGDTLSNLGQDVSLALNDEKLKQFATSYFAGQAVGANLVARDSGVVINPNLELLFQGPNLRTFSFNFRLTPRSKEEAERIRKIIRAFKRNMAVGRSTGNLFLTTPRIFQLKYIYKQDTQDTHPYLNKFKPCALTNFQVNYTPDGSYATFEDGGSLTAYDLTLNFSEVMPIYADDIPDSETTTMGY